MNAQEFAYWLQGFAELNEQPPTPEQWQSIREHLALVFTKVTPGIGPQVPQWPAQTWKPPLSPTCAAGPDMKATTTC
jgi:hypothetical protein